MAAHARNIKTTAKRTDLRESDNRFTPGSFVEAVMYSFGTIDFDPCWHPASLVHPVARFGVRRGADGLRDAWFGDVVFVNPPWSSQKQWLERAYGHWLCGNAQTVVCLVPAKTDTDLFHDILKRNADVYFIRGHPKFSREEDSSDATMVITMAVIFGATAEQKRRFADKIPGSWWQSLRRSSASAESMRDRAEMLAYPYSWMSCTSGAHDLRVQCGPQSG